jgi:hypothetical protein
MVPDERAPSAPVPSEAARIGQIVGGRNVNLTRRTSHLRGGIDKNNQSIFKIARPVKKNAASMEWTRLSGVGE